MHIESAAPVNPGLSLGHAKQAAKAGHEPPSVEQIATPSAESDDSPGQRGVIRHLLDGHYKGVADVRLRINFYDELQALEHGGVEQALSQPMPDLAAMQDELAGFTALGDELGPEVLQAIQKVDDLAQELAQAVEVGKQEALSMVERLRAAFEDLVVLLGAFQSAQAAEAAGVPIAQDEPEPANDSLTTEPPATEPPGTEPPATEPPAQDPAAAEPPSEVSGVEAPTPQTEPAPEPEPEPGPDPMALVSEFLANWGDLSLLDQLGALERTLDQAPALPELSPAGHNNGRAYAKFLAMYEELQSGAARDVDAPEGEVRIDAIV